MKKSNWLGGTNASLFVVTAIIRLCLCCNAQPLTLSPVAYPPVVITSLTYGNGTFLGSGGGLFCISHDGSNWTFYTSSPALNSGGVAYGNRNFLAFGTNSQYKANYVLQSTNGTSWTPIYTSSYTLFAAAFGNNTWVFIGTNDIVTATVTGSNWNWSEFEPDFSPACVAYGNGNFVIGASLQDGYSIFSSSDGIVWDWDTAISSPGPFPLPGPGIAFGNGIFVATVPENPVYGVYISTNISSWNGIGNGGNVTNSAPVAFGGNNFIISGNGTFSAPGVYGRYDYNLTSTNGYEWNAVSNAFGGPLPLPIDAFAYGQGTFVAAGYPSYSPYIYQSQVFANPSNSPAAILSISTYPGVTINGTAGATYQIQYTTNLNSSWQTLTNFMLPFSPYVWIDTSSPVVGQKLYRSVQLQ